MKNVLITGMNGFIGSALALRLLKDGCSVVGFVRDRNYKSRRDLHDRVSIVYGDLSDTDAVRYAVTKYEVDTVFHLGAITVLRMATVDPLTCYQSNVLGTVNVLEAVRNAPHVRKTVVASCYDESTRIVTPGGFKTYRDINIGDVVFSLNPETMAVEEALVEEVVVQEYSGPMVEFVGSRLNFMVTPNHRMCVGGDLGGIVFTPAHVKVRSSGWELPTGIWRGHPMAAVPDPPSKHWVCNSIGPYDVKDLMYMLGIFIGDGCIQRQRKTVASKCGMSAKEYVAKGKDPVTGRFRKVFKEGGRTAYTTTSNTVFLYIPTKDECRARVEETLTRMGLKWSHWKHSGEGAITLSSSELCHWFADAGSGAHNKMIPPWALQFGPGPLRCLLDGILDSDGSREKQLTTTSSMLVSGMVELCAKLGLNVSFRFHKPAKLPVIKGRVVNSRGAYRVYISSSSRSILPAHQSIRNYSGKVWCLRLNKNKNFLVERNGRTAFCGNSDKAYGTHDVLPYVEDMALLPADAYSTSKACTDLISRSYACTYGMDVSVVRSGNVFGPGDLNLSRLIPGAMLRILDGKRPVIYKGVGAYKREFLFIDDVVDAYVKVCERGIKGEAYNVGGSGFQTIIRTVEMIIEASGLAIEPEIVEKDFIEIKEQYLDATKLKNLGWKCRYPIADGIALTFPWYKSYHQDPSKLFWA